MVELGLLDVLVEAQNLVWHEGTALSPSSFLSTCTPSFALYFLTAAYQTALNEQLEIIDMEAAAEDEGKTKEDEVCELMMNFVIPQVQKEQNKTKSGMLPWTCCKFCTIHPTTLLFKLCCPHPLTHALLSACAMILP